MKKAMAMALLAAGITTPAAAQVSAQVAGDLRCITIFVRGDCDGV